MPEIQSPCLSCHLEKYSKDNPTCRDCDARCDYIKILDGAAPSPSILSAEKKAHSTKLQRAELYIQKICKKHFIELDDLKSQRYAGGLGDIKREVISTLYHEYKLTQKEIAHMFSKSENAIWVMLQNKSPKDKKPTTKTDDKIQITTDKSNKLDQSTQEPHKKVFYFSFKDHPTLYEHLIKTAKANFRKPEDHILYLINQEKLKETASHG